MENRSDLAVDALVDHFMEATESEDVDLFNALAELDLETGKQELAGVLGRFDPNGDRKLGPQERLLATRVLKRLHRPQAETLVLLNKVLDYLDLDGNANLDAKEMELIVEILELFGGAESDNGLLSQRELGMLYAVLRHMDANDNHALDAGERTELRRMLDDPKGFLAEQFQTNPLLAEFKS